MLLNKKNMTKLMRRMSNMCIKGYIALKKYNIDITNEKMKLFETLNLLCGENNKEYIYNMFYEIDNSKNIEGEKKEKNKENMEEQLEKIDTQHKKIVKEKDNLVTKLFNELDTLKSEYEKKQKKNVKKFYGRKNITRRNYR